MAMQRIQPRSPGQNGRIERCPRTGRKELYETFSPATPSTATGRMADVSWTPATLSGPMPPLAEGCPSGVHPDTLERASVATGPPPAPAGKPTPARPTQECTIS